MKVIFLYVIFSSIILVSLILFMFNKQFSEGFVAYPNSDFDMENPLLKIIKKLGVMSTYLVNPSVWTDAYSQSKMSAVELARLQIAKDKKNQGN
jgi:hypothetical protein